MSFESPPSYPYRPLFSILFTPACTPPRYYGGMSTTAETPTQTTEHAPQTGYTRYALTGGIGSGKSTIASLFAERGAVIIDADAISRSLMEPGEEVLARTVEAFGSEVLNEDGTLNRAALAAIVFSDESQRTKLNAIVHPAVHARAEEQVARALETPGFSGIIIDDIPLLVEGGRAGEFAGVVTIYTDLDTRLERLVTARGMDEADARARIAAQASDEQRAAIATWIIDNSGSLEESREQVDRIWSEMLEMLERSAAH